MRRKQRLPLKAAHVSAYLRTCETHALKEAVGHLRLAPRRTQLRQHWRQQQQQQQQETLQTSGHGGVECEGLFRDISRHTLKEAVAGRGAPAARRSMRGAVCVHV